jgi:hypothetical protein
MVSFALLLTLGYWAPNHMDINRQVVREAKPFNFKRGGHTVSKMDDYIKDVLLLDGNNRVVKAVKFDRANWFLGGDGDKPTDDPDLSSALQEWLISGGLWEDGFMDLDEGTCWGGYRAVNHFHNPIALTGNGGYHGFVDTTWGKTAPIANLFRSGTSAFEWASGGANGSEQNYWGTDTLMTSLKQYFNEDDKKLREKGIGNAFRAMGQVCHLIEDNTVPDHARDLAHPGNGFEEYMANERKSLFTSTPQAGWKLMPVTKVEQYGLRAFWDQDIYTNQGSNICTVGSKAGISEITNANFFAWNDFEKLGGAVHIWFSTLPAEPHKAYFNTDGNLALPWPEIDAKVAPGGGEPTYWTCTADTLGLNPAAFGRQNIDLDPNGPQTYTLDSSVWKSYALPLMQLAHGYAQSFLSTVLPPLDAELIPLPSDPLHKFILRVWNMGTDANLGNQVTWHVHAAQLKAIQPNMPTALPMLTNDTAPIPVNFTTFDIPPDGMPHDSDPITLSYNQLYAILNASHVAVELEADLGSAHPMPLKFGVMIPNAYSSIEQQTATIMDGPTSYQDECDVQCSPTWSQLNGTQSLHQLVTGAVKTYATKYDPLGQKAKASAIQAAQDIAHVAAIAVIASDEVMGIDKWRFPKGVTLTVSGNNQLTADSSGNPLWLRTQSADNTVAEPMQTSFSVDIHLDQAANPLFLPSTLEISNSLYLVVVMTSGAVTTMRIALWLPEIDTSLNGLVAGKHCPVGSASYAVTNSAWNTCSYSGPSSPPCDNPTSGTYRGRSLIMNVGFGATLAAQPASITFFNTQMPTLKALTLAGHPVPLMSGNQPVACGPGLGNVLANGGGPCGASTGVLLVEATTTPGGICAGASPPPGLFTPNATLTRDDLFPTSRITRALGQAVPPPISIQLQ